MTDPCDLPAVEARHLIGTRALSPVEAAGILPGAHRRGEPAVNAMVALDAEPRPRARRARPKRR